MRETGEAISMMEQALPRHKHLLRKLTARGSVGGASICATTKCGDRVTTALGAGIQSATSRVRRRRRKRTTSMAAALDAAKKRRLALWDAMLRGNHCCGGLSRFSVLANSPACIA